jgi:hypothetical protein
MMRTRDLTDPSSWRAWGGADFSVSLAASPYEPGGGGLDPAAHTCTPFTNSTYLTLTWSSLFNAYMAFGTADGDDHGGWAFALSQDLAVWSHWTRVDVGAFVVPHGNGSIVPTGKSLAGRFVKRADPNDPQIWSVVMNFIFSDNNNIAVLKERCTVRTCTPCRHYRWYQGTSILE